MFHGSPSSSRSLARLVACLGDRRSVIAFDTMGQGDSCPPPSADVTFEDYARFYAEALTSLGPAFDRIDLFGTHTGARIAAELAIAYPARTGRLILDGMRRGPSKFWHEYAAALDLSQDIDEDGTQFHKAWSKLRDSFFFFPSYRRDAAHFFRAAFAFAVSAGASAEGKLMQDRFALRHRVFVPFSAHPNA
jgi:pimeloyl-ACP methyl ester carboxylesterase